LPRRAQRARRAARRLSSFTVIVGMVIRRYYHARDEARDARFPADVKAIEKPGQAGQQAGQQMTIEREVITITGSFGRTYKNPSRTSRPALQAGASASSATSASGASLARSAPRTVANCTCKDPFLPSGECAR
jgi:hypothetical protein